MPWDAGIHSRSISGYKVSKSTVHFYRNIFSATPRYKMKEVPVLLKATHAQECKASTRENAKQVAERLK